MSTKAERHFATCAKLLEQDYVDNDGRVFGNRDAAIDGYVRMCRKTATYNVAPQVAVQPDYFVIPDGTARYELGFTLFIGRTEMGRISMLYIERGRLIVEIKGLGLRVDLPGIGEA